MLSPEFINLIFYKHNDISIALNFNTPNEDPVDISNWIIYFTIKDKLYLEDEDSTNTKVLLDIHTHADPENGLSGVFVPHTLIDDLHGIYEYDIQYKTGLNIIRTFARGQIQFLDSVTLRS